MSGGAKFGIEVNLLTGCYVATCYNDRQQGEWPPHPARLFSALVATWADADDPDQAEREALEWLESQEAPAIAAAAAVPRTVASHFVPVNDQAIIASVWHTKKALKVHALMGQLDDELGAPTTGETRTVLRLRQRIAKERDVRKQVTEVGKTAAASAERMLPDRRGKQERYFPSVRPDEPRITYLWDSAAPEEIRSTLDRLLERVTRLGHSATVVSCRVAPDLPKASHVPSTVGKSFRTVRKGQLAELERLHADHNGNKPRALPYTDVPYRVVADAPADEATLAADTVGDWIVFEFAHNTRAFPAPRVVEVSTTMRDAIFRHVEDPMPAELSGHEPDGNPVKSPHLAFLPLPYVGYEHADGRLLGIALSAPQTLADDARQALYRAIGGWEKAARGSYPLRLTFGSAGVLHMRRLRGSSLAVSLRPGVWRRPSRKWVSATPIALPRHPGRLVGCGARARAKAWRDAERAVVAACGHVDLPDPTHVEVSLVPFIAGAHAAHRFPPFNQSGLGGKSIRRQLVHALVTFDHRVTGPLMLGAGRFFGLGLMRPFDDGQSP